MRHKHNPNDEAHIEILKSRIKAELLKSLTYHAVRRDYLSRLEEALFDHKQI